MSEKYRLLLFCLILLIDLSCSWSDDKIPTSSSDRISFGKAQLVGRNRNDRLDECSGMDISLSTPDLLWAINDSGDGPFLYATGMDGRKRGRVRVAGARNRDWEGLDTFLWRDRPMILIADTGDNDEQYKTHTLYIAEDPRLNGERFADSATTEVAWKVVFNYPDGRHDAEAVAVDPVDEKILVLTKRDSPPLLFELPLKPPPGAQPITARKVAEVSRIPPPSAKDLLYKFGFFMSTPTGLDLSPDGKAAVVLTYKHAYLFKRNDKESWASALGKRPTTIPLPLPQEHDDLRQREAICFTSDGKALFITSEGRKAGIYRVEIKK